jgi:hypothetical protein
MATNTNRDFASLLDDLMVATGTDEGTVAASHPVSFDYLAVADELYSGLKVSDDTVEAGYRETGANIEAEFSALLAEADLGVTLDAPAAELPIEPEAIAVELGLSSAMAPVDFSRLRRNFAFKNHPDRVAPHLRQRAMVRMQVANMLIDDAKRRALKPARR